MDDQTGPDEADVLRVQLELHLDCEPISGRLRTGRGVEEQFVGWLGFIDALKRLQEQGEGSTYPASEPPDP
jgi:hypothetical protein